MLNIKIITITLIIKTIIIIIIINNIIAFRYILKWIYWVYIYLTYINFIKITINIYTPIILTLVTNKKADNSNCFNL